jgi:hypothetical protein
MQTEGGGCPFGMRRGHLLIVDGSEIVEGWGEG